MEEFLNFLWPGLAPWNERRTLVALGVIGVIFGGTLLAYASSSYTYRGPAPETLWFKTVRALLVAAPLATVIGGAMCAFPVTRRHGLRLVVSGVGVAVGFSGGLLVIGWVLGLGSVG